VEIQVRTYLQHLWAELSERSSDVVDSDIKYGGGDLESRNLLAEISEHIKNLEGLEKTEVEFPGIRMQLPT
jgi:ppGpp synthetase/RelA/SpoT-type nucleotidyltranferase